MEDEHRLNGSHTTLESIYDTYSAMLYSIALEISPSSKEAELILISTFQKVQLQKLKQQSASLRCVTLIKLIVKTAQQKFHPGQTKNNFKLKRFENTPILHQLLCEQTGIRTYCEEKKITRADARKKIREEFLLLRNLESEGRVSVEVQESLT